MSDPFIELNSAPLVIANITMWNTLAAQGALPAFLKVSAQVPTVDLLEIGFSTVETGIIFGDIEVQSLPALELITAVAAARLAVCEAQRGLLAKRLPGGWKVSADSYSTFVQAINSQPVLASRSPLCSYILRCAGLNSLPGLVQAIRHVGIAEWRVVLAGLQQQNAH